MFDKLNERFINSGKDFPELLFKLRTKLKKTGNGRELDMESLAILS